MSSSPVLLLADVDPGQLASFDDPRERLMRSYRSWLLSALDRLDEALGVADDGLADAQRDRQNWAIHVFESWKGLHLLHLGKLDEANTLLEDRFYVADAQLIVGVLDAAAVTALGRVKLHLGDERGAREVAEIARVMLTATAPVVRKLAAWYLAVHSMASGHPDQAHDWLCTFGQTQRLSLFPLFPMEAADDPLLVRMALAAEDEELAKAATNIAAHRYELNPGVPSAAGAARPYPRPAQPLQTRPGAGRVDPRDRPAPAGRGSRDIRANMEQTSARIGLDQWPRVPGQWQERPWPSSAMFLAVPPVPAVGSCTHRGGAP